MSAIVTVALDDVVPPGLAPAFPAPWEDLPAASRRRHCIPCDVKWVGDTECWNCGLSVAAT